MRIFDFDGPVYKIGNEIADALIVTLLWVVFSIPLITLGASTSALFYIYGKKSRGEDTYIMKDFWKSFKQNFLQSIPITLILGVMWLSVYTYTFLVGGSSGLPATLISGLALFFTLEVTIVTIYVLAVLSRFHMRVGNMFLTSFVLAHRHIGSTAMILAVVIVLQYLSMTVPFLLFLTPVIIVATASYPIQKIFNKHIEGAKAAEESQSEMIEDDNAWDDETDDEEDGNEENKDFLKYI